MFILGKKYFFVLILATLAGGTAATPAWGMSDEAIDLASPSDAASVPLDQTGTAAIAPDGTVPPDASADFMAPGPLSQSSEEDLPPANFSEISGEQCSKNGDEANGYRYCVKKFSDGTVEVARTDIETFGESVKKQTVIQEFDARELLIHKKSVRQKTDYLFQEGKRIKSIEHFDIVERPFRGKITREFIILEYFPESGRIRKLTWAKYRQMGDEMLAEITHHAYFTYDFAGNPLRGKVEKWENFKVADTLMSWNRAKNPHFRIEESDWRDWESRFLNLVTAASNPVL
ncbi:MAG: hypothetical protein ACOY3K_01470 [Candidatus Omnitrophota bacterium]